MQLILTADDFGLSNSVNAAVMRAHQQGVLTSASLMVAGDAAAQAVALAKATPTLAVGLHVVLASGRSLLPPQAIPHLVDATGKFPGNPLIAGLRCVATREARAELRLELEAQFESFAASGVPLNHVDSHLHYHIHPFVLDLLLPLAQQYGARGLRIPHDDLGQALAYDRHRAVQKIGLTFIFGLLGRLYHAKIRRYRLAVADRVYGMLQSGQMSERYVLGLLETFNAPAAEIFFHPDLAPTQIHQGPNPDDLATLLSPAIRQMIKRRGIRLATYADL